MTNPPPFWTTKERKQTAYTWSHDGVERAGTLDDVARAIGTPTVASHNEVSNYEGEQASDDAPILNERVKMIEIVKQNGCYTLQEDGRNRTPNEPGSGGEGGGDGSSDEWLQYTIGRARCFEVNKEEPHVSPLMLRVRLEDGELPPSQCKLSVRTVMIQETSVVDHSTHDVGDVPVSSVSDTTAPGIVIGYPASATIPLQTTLISKRRSRNAIDASKNEDVKKQRREDKDLFPPLRRVEKELSVPFRFLKNAGGILFELGKRVYLTSHWGARLAGVSTNFDYFTYGNAKESVFKDINNDINSIIDVISTKTEDESLYRGFSQRQRELFEFIVGFDGQTSPQDQGKDTKGTTLAAIRDANELNEADCAGMFKSRQAQYRIDTHIDVEIWDPQFEKQLNITIAPGIEEALKAGFLLQCNVLQRDFNNMTSSINRLVTLLDGEKGGRFQRIIRDPPGFVDRRRLISKNYKTRCAHAFRKLLGLPPVTDKTEEEWRFANVTDWSREKWSPKVQLLTEADWDRLPMFQLSEKGYLPYEYKQNAVSSDFVTRIIHQLVIPKRVALGTIFEAHVLEATSETEGQMVNTRHSIAAAQLLRRKLDLISKNTMLNEKSSGSKRLRFHTVYKWADGMQDALDVVYSSTIRSTMPFSSMYPNSVAIHIGMVSYSADEDYVTDAIQTVTGEPVFDPTARADAIEAFAAMLMDVLGTKGVSSLSARDLTESVIEKTNRRVETAAKFLKSVFVQTNAAMVDADDALLWLTSGSASALIALNHSTCWQSQWTSISSLQGRAVWIRKMNAFSNALRSVARSRIRPTEIPLLNVQSNWVSGRLLHPIDTVAVKYTILQTEMSFRRVKSILSKMVPNTPLFKNTAIIAIQDVVLARPLVWRVQQDQLKSILTQYDELEAYKGAKDIKTRPISYEELVHSWASRRVNVQEDDYEQSAYESDIQKLSNSLSRCSVRGEDCLYYVPVCCDSLPDMKALYDPRLAQQSILLENLEKVFENKQRFDPNRGVNATIYAIDAFENGRPTHPLFIKTTADNQICVHIPSHASYLPGVFKSDANADTYMKMSSIDALLSALASANQVTKVDTTPMLLHDARRTVVFAIDRIYQSLLYAISLYYNADQIIVGISLNENPPTCPGWPLQAPKRVESIYNTNYAFPDAKNVVDSDRKMLLVAIHFALALLPIDMAEKLSFKLIGFNSNDVTGVVEALNSFKEGLKSSNFSSVPIGEAVACVVHACF